MEIKYTIQGLLIYTAIIGYLAAFLSSLFGRRKTKQVLYIIGFAFSTASFGYRWYNVSHVPLQNLFEVFLFAGMICYPVSQFGWRSLRIVGQRADMLLAAIVLFPAGFIFNAQPQQLPPVLQSSLFAPHVAVYILSYIFMAKASFLAILELAGKNFSDSNLLPPEQATYYMIRIGFPLLTLGLVLGSLWGKLAWGDYWGWDPKESWSLASWLVYVGYFHFRYMFGKKYSHINSIWSIAGIIVIVITLFWVNLSRLFVGMHSYAI